jgi:hypothetical protein
MALRFRYQEIRGLGFNRCATLVGRGVLIEPLCELYVCLSHMVCYSVAASCSYVPLFLGSVQDERILLRGQIVIWVSRRVKGYSRVELG